MKKAKPKDVSKEFLTMGSLEFAEFLEGRRSEPAFSITMDWVDIFTAEQLKTFLQAPRAKEWGQERYVTIRATKEQYKQVPDVFKAGVKWKKVKK